MILNILVLLLEVLFYSIFMKLTRRKGKFYRYLISFSIITIIGIFIKTNYFVSYFLLVTMILYSLKYIVKVDVSLYDVLVILFMLILKSFLEVPIYYLLVNKINRYVLSITASSIKFIFLLLIGKNLNILYNYFKIKWNNNNFYVRYLFSVVLYLYVIIVAILLIFR